MSHYITPDSLVPVTREECEARARTLVVLLQTHIAKFSAYVAPKHLRQHEEEIQRYFPNVWTGDDDQWLYVEELATWTALAGRESPLERYSRRAKLIPGTDSAALIAAAHKSVLSFWKFEGRHPTAGWILRDMMFGGTAWVVEDMFEHEFEPQCDEWYLMRLLRVDQSGFWIVCSNVFAAPDEPIDPTIYEKLSSLRCIGSGSARHVAMSRMSAVAAVFYSRAGIYVQA